MAINLTTEALAALHTVANKFSDISLIDILNMTGRTSVYHEISKLKGDDTVSELKHRLETKAEEFVKSFVCDEEKVRGLFSGLEGLNHDKTVEVLMFSKLFLEEENGFVLLKTENSDKKDLEALLVSLANCTLVSQKQITKMYIGYADGVEVERFQQRYKAEEFKAKRAEHYFKEEIVLSLDNALYEFLENLGAGFESEQIKLLKALIWLYTISDKASGKLSSYSTFAYEFICNKVHCESNESWIELIELAKKLSHDDEVSIENSVQFATDLIKMAAKANCFRIG